jgi:opacity protein-like surface antigen
LGNIALGYGYDLPKNFYIGSELTANIGKIIADITRVGVLYQDQILHHQTTIQDYVALDITPGFKINNNLLLYARMGMVDGKISITQDTIPSVVGFQNSANKVGGRLGLGIDYTIANFGVGADYIYSFYSSFDTKSPRNTEYNLIPRSHILGLHVRYNFK